MEMDPFFAVTDAVDAKKPASSEKSPTKPSVVVKSTIVNKNDNDDDDGSNDNDDVMMDNNNQSNHSAVVSIDKKTPPVMESSSTVQVTTTTTTTDAKQPNNGPSSSSSSSGIIISDAAVVVVDHVQLANEELANLLLLNNNHHNHSSITQSQVSSLQHVLRENGSLKAKITKLKSLLQRSAKAQKDAKVELAQSKTRYDQAQNQILQLQRRVENLTNRPTHMDLLADFESNFDKALLSFNHQQPSYNTTTTTPNHHWNNETQSSQRQQQQQQAGGQESTSADSFLQQQQQQEKEKEEELLAEQLQKANARIQQLETRWKTTNAKRIEIEDALEETKLERDLWQSKCNDYQLETRMAKMEMERATRAVKEKTATLEEMQLEMNLMYKSVSEAYKNAQANSSHHNNQKYNHHHHSAAQKKDNSLSTEQAEEMKAKMEALQEWAIASANVKSVLTERIALLTEQVQQLKKSNDDDNDYPNPDSDAPSVKSDTLEGAPLERKLWSKSSSLVVGAGMVGSFVVNLGDDLHFEEDETIVLKWKFDITPADTDIDFSILKGVRDDVKKLSRVRRHTFDAVLRDIHVSGGGAGEVQGAFAIQNACTLIWSNEKSWIRPKTIKFYLQAFAIL